MSKLAKRDGTLALRLPRPGEAYWQVVSPYWEQVDIYSGGDAFLRTFANVPEPAGHLLALHWCQSEVCNGGLTEGLRRKADIPALGEFVPQAAVVQSEMEKTNRTK